MSSGLNGSGELKDIATGEKTVATAHDFMYRQG
jgi:hypothetical protein